MAANDFFARWSKAGPGPVMAPVGIVDECAPAAAAASDTGVSTAPTVARTLTLEDAAALTADADFKPFMAANVEAGVKRLALKQLFADPRFNIMDGLDTYIDDYNQFVPMDAAMVAALNHGKALLDPLAHLLLPGADLALPAVDRPEPPTDAAAADGPAQSAESNDQSTALAASVATVAPALLIPGIHDESLPGL